MCTRCWWEDESSAGQVGAWFTGRNELPHRTWETRSQVVAAKRGREFAWVVGGDRVRWGYTLTPAGTGTTLTESWNFLPGGIAMFKEKFGDDAPAQILDRTRQALEDIPQTLAAINRIAESSCGAGSGSLDRRHMQKLDAEKRPRESTRVQSTPREGPVTAVFPSSGQ